MAFVGVGDGQRRDNGRRAFDGRGDGLRRGGGETTSAKIVFEGGWRQLPSMAAATFNECKDP